MLAAKLNSWSHRFKNFSAHTQAMMLLTALSLAAMVAFLELASTLSVVQVWDEAILLWVETLRTPFLNAMMVDVTALGGLALTVVLGLLAVVLFLMTRDPAAAIHYIFTATGGFFISLWSKGIVERPRPTVIPQLVKASGFSFPSGHSITTAAVYVTLAILISRHFNKHTHRVILFFLAAAMITLVSFSRIYLGVHYPSDTLSGTFLGAAWALLVAVLFAKIHWGPNSRHARSKIK